MLLVFLSAVTVMGLNFNQPSTGIIGGLTKGTGMCNPQACKSTREASRKEKCTKKEVRQIVKPLSGPCAYCRYSTCCPEISETSKKCKNIPESLENCEKNCKEDSECVEDSFKFAVDGCPLCQTFKCQKLPKGLTCPVIGECTEESDTCDGMICDEGNECKVVSGFESGCAACKTKCCPTLNCPAFEPSLGQKCSEIPRTSQNGCPSCPLWICPK